MVHADHQRQRPAVVPANMELAGIVNVVQGAHAAGYDRVRIVPHLAEPDPVSGGVLLPQKLQPLLLDHFRPPIFMPRTGALHSSSRWISCTASKIAGSLRKLSICL